MAQKKQNPNVADAGPKTPKGEEYTVHSPKTHREVTVQKDLGANLQEAISLFGEDRVFGLYKAQAVIRLQSAVRSVLDRGGSVEDAKQTGAEWRPDVVRRKAATVKDPVVEALARAARGEISTKELQAIIAQRLTELGGDAETQK